MQKGRWSASSREEVVFMTKYEKISLALQATQVVLTIINIILG